MRASLAAAGLDLLAPFVDPDDATHQAYLVGNTRALWPRFVAALQTDPTLLDHPHPLEAYVERAVHAAIATATATATVTFAHTGPPWIPIQRLAERAGLAWLAPSHLSIHPTYGPWISLRAVIHTDEPPSQATQTAAPPPPCAHCDHACLPAFRQASGHASAEAAETHWRLWLAVRDACPTGRAHRFQEDHITYGYTKDRTVLSRLGGGRRYD